MKTYLVTGCAGFIGTNFVYYMLNKYPEIKLVNLDKLTYAGNLENLKDCEGDERHTFVQGDICDKELVTRLFEQYDFDYVINFAAESHVDRSISNPEIFVQSNVMGTVNLLQCAKNAWYDAEKRIWKEGKKYLQVSTDEVYGTLGETGYFMETTPLCPHSPYSSSKASADLFVMAYHDLRHAGEHHPLLQQLRPLSVPGKADSPDDQQREAAQEPAGVRRWNAGARLAVCGGPLQGH